MSDNWKKSMDTLINEVGKMKAYLKNDEKNKLENFIGLLKRVKAISLSSNKGGGQRGGTRMPDGSYVCNTCGSPIHPDHLITSKDGNKHFHSVTNSGRLCYNDYCKRRNSRDRRNSGNKKRSKSLRIIKPRTAIEQANNEAIEMFGDDCTPRTHLRNIREILAMKQDAWDVRVDRVQRYVGQIGYITVGGMGAYTSYYLTQIITGYLLQWAITSFPSWTSYEERKAGERAERELANHVADMEWRARNGYQTLPIQENKPPPEPLPIGCGENSERSMSCLWNTYWGNMQPVDNEGYLALPEQDPTGGMELGRWDAFRLGVRRIQEGARDAAQNFWQDLTYNPLNAFQTIGLLGDIIIRTAHLLDTIIPFVVALWWFHLCFKKALEIGRKPDGRRPDDKKEGGKRRKKTRKKRRKTRRKSKKRKSKRRRRKKTRKKRR